jgi:hypothetical protein
MVVGSHRQAPVTLPTRRRPGMHFKGGWACPRAGLDGYGKSRPNRNSIPGPSSPWRVATLPTLSWPNRYSKKWVILINSLHRLSLPSILYSLCHSFLSSLSFILPCLLECGHDHFVEGKLRQVCVPEIHVWHLTQLAGCLHDEAAGCVYAVDTHSSDVLVSNDEVSYRCHSYEYNTSTFIHNKPMEKG